MSTAILVLPGPFPSPRQGAVRTTVFLPKEHGSWFLALEPLALGLLLAPSWAGGALAGAVLAGFFARRPLKAAFATGDPLRRLDAREALVMWMALALAGLFEAGVLGGWAALWPLTPAVALGLWFAHRDGQGGARRLSAELAGCAAFALVPAAVATLAGQRPAMALTLAALMLARNLPAVLAVRTYLGVAKGAIIPRAWPVAASVAGAIALVWLAASGAAPRCAGALGTGLLVRTLWLLGPWRPAWPARRIGQVEAALGILYVFLLVTFWPSP